VAQEGVKPNPKKSIKLFFSPKAPNEIRSFLILIGYYRKFIKEFAKIYQNHKLID